MLKHVHRHSGVDIILPAAFRRLCVETKTNLYPLFEEKSSRLQAAVC